MKKMGFTIAELLVTLGIIGIIAAITTPMINSLLPDNNKAKVLKAYNTISKVTQELIEDPQIYPGDESFRFNRNRPSCQNKPYFCGCEGLMCEYPPYEAEKILHDKYPNITYHYSLFFSTEKFKNLFALKLDVVTDPDPVFLFTSNTVANKTGFTTSDGIKWDINSKSQSPEGVLITIDLDDSSSSVNCHYDKTNCKKPDQFNFYINKYGQTFANDALTKAYLENPNNLKDKTKDYETAKNDTTSTWVSKDYSQRPRPR